MRTTPFSSLQKTLRIFLKALFLLVAFNFICLLADFNPVTAITQFNLWGLVGDGQARLAYTRDFRNGQLPIEALLATHTLTHTPKAEDEYRVFVLGNSGPFAGNLGDDETVSAQLTARNLSVNNQKVVAYNLGYPSANAPLCSVIFDAAKDYEPDLVILFVTANMFNNREEPLDTTPFFAVNRQRFERLAVHVDMEEWLNGRLSPVPVWDSWLGIRDQGTLMVWLSSILNPFVEPIIPRTSRRIAQEPVPSTPNNFASVPGTYPMPNEAWDWLLAMRQLAQEAGAELLIVNQPTAKIDSPYSDVSYSGLYGREFYDDYLEAISNYTQEHDLWYIDLWQTIPQEYYTDSELHPDQEGWSLVVNELTPIFDTLSD